MDAVFLPEHSERDAFLESCVNAGRPMGEGDMQSYNGACGAAQLAWLGCELRGCRERGESVVVASHHCLAPGASRETHRCWNGTEVARLLVASGVVRLALAGHDHHGGFARFCGVPFVTCEAVLESTEANAFGLLRIRADRIEIDGCGTQLRSHSFDIPSGYEGLVDS